MWDKHTGHYNVHVYRCLGHNTVGACFCKYFGEFISLTKGYDNIALGAETLFKTYVTHDYHISLSSQSVESKTCNFGVQPCFLLLFSGVGLNRQTLSNARYSVLVLYNNISVIRVKV